MHITLRDASVGQPKPITKVIFVELKQMEFQFALTTIKNVANFNSEKVAVNDVSTNKVQQNILLKCML